MPYAKTRRYRRKRFGRRRYKRPSAWSSAKNLAYKGYKLAKYVRSLVNVEYKLRDFTTLGGALSTGGTIQLLTDVPEGVTATSRTGRSIKLKSLHLKAMLFSNTASTFSYMNRIIIFMDKDTRGIAPTVADLIADPTDMSSPMNINNTKRFIILYNKSFVTGINGSGHSMYNVEYFKKFNLDLTYQGNAGGTVDCDTNHLYVFFQTSNAATPPTLEGYSRIRFIDN